MPDLKDIFMEKTFTFNSQQLESSLASFSEKGITEFTLQDSEILGHKGRLLRFLQAVRKNAPDLFVTLPVDAKILDMDVCKACAELNCSLDIVLDGENKGGNFLFDKKFFARRAQMLNTLGLVFGFDLSFALHEGDKLKSFFDRLNFSVGLYPNHIDFPQIETEISDRKKIEAKPTATFSTQDIRRSENIARSASVFYSYGRAVTWFLAVLAPLKIEPVKFFEDFFEWQKLNNYGLENGIEKIAGLHSEIEKMQLEFLKFKYEEKNKGQLFEVVSNIVRLNGALSRCFGEGEESIVEMSYNPDEILSGQAMNVQSFFDNAFMEYSRVRVFMGSDGPDFKYC